MMGSDMNVPVSLFAMFSSTAGNPWVIIGAFAGSIIFIVSEVEYTHWAKLGLFTAAMIIGVSSAELVASLISYFFLRYLDFKVMVPNSVGATVSSVISIRMLMYVSSPKNGGIPIISRITKEIKKQPHISAR